MDNKEHTAESTKTLRLGGGQRQGLGNRRALSFCSRRRQHDRNKLAIPQFKLLLLQQSLECILTFPFLIHSALVILQHCFPFYSPNQKMSAVMLLTAQWFSVFPSPPICQMAHNKEPHEYPRTLEGFSCNSTSSVFYARKHI